MMLSYLILGIEISLVHFLLFYFYTTKSRICVFLSIIPIVLACFQGRIGMALVIMSLVAFGIVCIISWFAKKHEIKNSFLIIVSVLVFILITFSIFHNIHYSSSFEGDVLKSYIKRLYGTGGFSAVPFLDMCVMHFVFGVFVVYFLFVRSKVNVDAFFASISITVFAYIFLIGFCYIRLWALDNMSENGEYLTGVANYMMIISVMYYCFFAGVVYLAITRKIKENR